MDPYKILVVEDDSYISELIEITLSSPLYAISCVDSGAGALAKLTEEKPDLVVLDILIPEPDGWKLYKILRDNPALMRTRVIILSALLFRPEFLRGKNILPSDMVMKKPFDLDDLRKNVKDLLAAGFSPGSLVDTDSAEAH
jgi:DNA-binding response OmpR family regulator